MQPTFYIFYNFFQNLNIFRKSKKIAFMLVTVMIASRCKTHHFGTFYYLKYTIFGNAINFSYKIVWT
jgi:hypothetical protein